MSKEKQIKERNELLNIFAPSSLSFEEARILTDKIIETGYRKQSVGEWIWDKEHSNYKCSLCGEYDIGVPKFCRECGAKMRGGAE